VLITLAVVVVLAVAAAVVATRSSAPEPDADEALDRAAAAMESAGSFRMHQVSEERTQTGDEGGAGSSNEYRTVTDAEVSGDDLHVRSDSGDYIDETVIVDGTLYDRYVDGADELDGEQWEAYTADFLDDTTAAADEAGGFLEMTGLDFDGDGEIDDDYGTPEDIENTVVSALGDYYLYGLGPVDGGGGLPVPLPTGFVDAFGSFEDAEVVAHDGDTLVLSATRRPPAELAEAADFDVPSGVFEITLGADDLPTKLTMTVDGRTAHEREDVTFTDWDADIAIDVPQGDIDRTPWVDEEAVAAARARVTPLAPTDVPDGLVLSALDGMTSEDMEDEGSEPCAQLYLSYAPPLDDEAATEAFATSPDYLDIYLLPADCATGFDPSPFEPGEFGDVPTRTSNDFEYVEVLVGDTVVQFDTSYDGDELAAMVASLAPFDLDAELARTGEIAQQTGGFGF
jgi:hypothetical protein